MNTKPIYQDLEKWKADLTFYRDEITILNRYLDNVSEKPSPSEMKGEIASFQLQLSEKMETSIELIEGIRIYEASITSGTDDNNNNAQPSFALDEKIADFSRDYASLKSSFVRFLARTEMII